MEKTKRNKRPLTITIVIVLFLVGCVLGGIIFISVLASGLPSPNDFGVEKINQSTKIYDREGKVLLYEIHGEEKRTIIPFEEIPDIVKYATLAIEDSDFYNQPAFDWKSITRAFIVNLKQGRTAQGGSTITQQLAKNIFLSPEKTYTRKIKELILAIQLESKYSKDEIFYFYLNQIPYGSNAYGIEAASETFFGKPAKELNLEEAALLAALPRASSFYSPYGEHTNELAERKDYVLEQMKKLGFITEEEQITAQQKEIQFIKQSIGSIRAPHFSLKVKNYLAEKYGEEELIRKGYKVITTLDWKLQEIAEKVVLEGSKSNEKLYSGKNAALVAEDPKTGQILALVGSRDYFDESIDGNFNVATQGLRQPGSALKPFIYLTAFEGGYSEKTKLFDVKTEFDTRGGSESYSPENFDGIFHGPISMEESLAWSINVNAVKTLYLVGMDTSLNTLHKFGITTLQDKNRYSLTLVLGGGEIKLIDLVKAYATLSQEGVKHEQVFILKIEDSEGNVVEEFKKPEGEVVFNPENPRRINNILTNTNLRAGLLQSSLQSTIFPGYEVALKTGTSQDYRDAWAFGYTPFLVVGVWAGNSDSNPMARQGGSLVAAIPMWSKFWGEALPNFQPEFFQKPEEPILSQKTMLNGEYIWLNEGSPEIHSVLYYVNKNDPLGPPNKNPSIDPQFKNWELAVLNWALENQSNINIDPNKIKDLYGGVEEFEVIGNQIVIKNVFPKDGEILTSPFTIKADVFSGVEIKKIELLQNKKIINSINVGGSSFEYRYYFYGLLGNENDFEIRVTNSGNTIENSRFKIYRK